MTGTASKAGWGIVLKGHKFDLDYWAENFKTPFNPRVEIHGTNHLLRTDYLDQLPTGFDVYEAAAAELERLNGIMAITAGTEALAADGIAQINADGTVSISQFVIPQGVTTRSKVGAVGVAISPNAQPSPPPAPKPSSSQNWYGKSEQDDRLADAFVYYSRATNWFDIYKALESLELKFGGEAALINKNWVAPGKIKDLKYAANWGSRHARGKFQSPKVPMKIDEAKQILRELIQNAMA